LWKYTAIGEYVEEEGLFCHLGMHDEVEEEEMYLRGIAGESLNMLFEAGEVHLESSEEQYAYVDSVESPLYG
jgi:hypothetical protein